MFRKGDIVRRKDSKGRRFLVESIKDGWCNLSPCRKDGRRVLGHDYGFSGHFDEARCQEWEVLGHFDGDHWGGRGMVPIELPDSVIVND